MSNSNKTVPDVVSLFKNIYAYPLRYLFGGIALFFIFSFFTSRFVLFNIFNGWWYVDMSAYMDKNLANALQAAIAMFDTYVFYLYWSWKKEKQDLAYNLSGGRLIFYYLFVFFMTTNRPIDQCLTEDLEGSLIFENCGQKIGRYGKPVYKATYELLKKMEKQQKQKGNTVEKDTNTNTNTKSKAERDKDAEELIKRLKEAQPR